VKIAFVTWDGDAQNYLESLYLPIFGALARRGYPCHVVQFTWASPERRRALADAASRCGVTYRGFPIVRQPVTPGAIATIAYGVPVLAYELRRVGAEVVLPRSLMPAAIALGAMAGRSKRSLLFDADGLKADERVDFAGWAPSGGPYRALRAIESAALERAEMVITRTQAAREILLTRGRSPGLSERIHVVPNGKDATLFAPGTASTRAETRLLAGVPEDAPWIVYAGSIGAQYYPEAMARLFSLVRARDARARLHVLTGQAEALRAAFAAADVSLDGVVMDRVAPAEVASYVAAADVALALRRPSFSQRAVCPIKIAEYLLCGTPAVATRGVGDVEDDLGVPDTGLLMDEPCLASLESAAVWILDEVIPHRRRFRDACRARGVERFSLQVCVDGYVRALQGCAANAASPREVRQ